MKNVTATIKRNNVTIKIYDETNDTVITEHTTIFDSDFNYKKSAYDVGENMVFIKAYSHIEEVKCSLSFEHFIHYAERVNKNIMGNINRTFEVEDVKVKLYDTENDTIREEVYNKFDGEYLYLTNDSSVIVLKEEVINKYDCIFSLDKSTMYNLGRVF